MTKKIWFLAIICLLSFAITINLPKISDVSQNQPESTPINLGYSNWPGWWLWEIAKEEKLFEKNGINVQLRWFDNYSDSLEALAAGTLDANCQTLNDTIPQVQNAIYGEVVVLVNDNSAGNDKIIVSQDIKNIEGLKGKKVALEEGVVDDFLLTLALKKNNMGRDDVKIIDLETGAAAIAFAQGVVDGVGAFPPFWLDALKREGSHELVTSADFPGAIVDLLVVTQKLIDERPEQVQALVDTWFDLLDFMEKNPEAANQIIASRAQVNIEELELFQSGVKLFSREDNLSAFKKGNNMTHLNFTAQTILDFFESEFKIIETKPKINKLFNPQFIQTNFS